VCVYAHVCVCKHVCMHVYICMCERACVQTYMYMNICSATHVHARMVQFFSFICCEHYFFAIYQYKHTFAGGDTHLNNIFITFFFC